MSENVGRRRFLQGAAGGVAAGALAAGTTFANRSAGHDASGGEATASAAGSAAAGEQDVVNLARSYPFYDQPHPPGIETPPQRHAIVMTFDLIDGSTQQDLQTLLARWTAAISLLMAGRPVGQVQPTRPEAVGQDTGEVVGLEPAGLTVTVGLGPTLFDDRFGLAAKRPALLKPLPTLPSDNLVAANSGGDLSLQVCSDDPQVCYHAVRNLARMVRTTALTRWTVIGFGRASAGKGQQTPRNLFGFKDGTRNVTEAVDRDRFVWLDDAGWMTGGTYQVIRKIEMNIEIWDSAKIAVQENIFGRNKVEGAPLTGKAEFDTPDFTTMTQGAEAVPVIDTKSHIALSAPENNSGIKILRRGYNFTDGINEFGQLDAGLLFITYVNDPAHFVQLQTKLGAADLLNEYILHVGSGIFAVPPTPATGHYIGEQLFT